MTSEGFQGPRPLQDPETSFGLEPTVSPSRSWAEITQNCSGFSLFFVFNEFYEEASLLLRIVADRALGTISAPGFSSASHGNCLCRQLQRINTAANSSFIISGQRKLSKRKSVLGYSSSHVLVLHPVREQRELMNLSMK